MADEHELPMGGCSRASDHYAHLARGESRCENEWERPGRVGVVRFVGGPLDGSTVALSAYPAQIEVEHGGSPMRYERLDDPETGEFLWAYVPVTRGEEP